MQRIHKLNVKEGVMFIDNVVDIFYLIGKKVSKGTLLVFPESIELFVDTRYTDACKNIPGVTTHMYNTTELDEFLKEKAPKTVLIEEKTLSYMKYNYLKKVLPEAKLQSTTSMQEIRSVKDPDELEKLKRAGALNVAACEHAISMLKPGITEREMAWEYEKYAKEHGGEDLSFTTIVAFGKNSAYPHYQTGDAKLEKGMPVLIDCGITVDRYTSDMTRSFFYEEEANPTDYALWKKHFDIVKECYERACQIALPGEMLSTLDQRVQDYVKEQGVQEHIRHTLGHSIGLEVHEWPRLTFRLPNVPAKENMVVTIEPGLYFEGKWGIRYENTLVITSSGVKNFSEKGALPLSNPSKG